MNVFSGGDGGNNFHSLWFGGGDFQETLPYPVMKSHCFCFNAVMPSGSFSPDGGALETFFRRQIQQYRHIRDTVPDRIFIQAADKIHIKLPGVPLVSCSRIGKTVAKDDSAAFDRRFNQETDVLGAAGRKQQKFLNS